MRIFWFVLLKIVEIGSVVFGPYYLGKLVHCFTEFFCGVNNAGEIVHSLTWLIGIGTILITTVLLLIGVLCAMILCLNWELADKIRDRFK